ncbi:hypothetical protein [Streptomyces pinistramenti]|nr:hypothetical protein [Streptomyces pinistramenti]MCB5911095.1 hypothetical protein [Streptomyces pinistramenti]
MAPAPRAASQDTPRRRAPGAAVPRPPQTGLLSGREGRRSPERAAALTAK